MIVALLFCLREVFNLCHPSFVEAEPSFHWLYPVGSVAGPILSGLVSAVYDICFPFLLSQGQPFIIWFTLIEALQGILYGYFFLWQRITFERKKDWLWVTLATIAAVMGVGPLP